MKQLFKILPWPVCLVLRVVGGLLGGLMLFAPLVALAFVGSLV